MSDQDKRIQEWRKLATVALQQAGKRKIELEIRFGASDSLTVKIRKGELEDLRQNAPFGVSARAFSGPRCVSGSSSHVDQESIKALVDRLADNVVLVDEDDANGLPDKELLYSGGIELDLFDAKLAEVTVDQAREMAVAAENAAFAVDKRITNSSGASVGLSRSLSCLFNSRGLEAREATSGISVSAGPVAEDDKGEKYSEGWWSTARHLADLEAAEAVGREAGRRCVAMIGAEKLPTGKSPVLFVPETAKDLVELLFSCVGGDVVYKNSTFLAEEEGKKIASKLVTIVDDPHRKRGLSSSPYDAEGVATKRMVVVDNGVLKFFPCDTFSARRLGRQSTGHSSGGGVTSYNLYLKNGTTPADKMMAELGKGLVVTAFIGFSFNKATGDFSRGVRGFWVEDGKIVKPVQEITVSGNLGQMFNNITTIGNDLNFRFGTDSPSFIISEMMISGA
jgi:PmbA protein